MHIRFADTETRARVEPRTDGEPGARLTFEALPCETFDDRDVVRNLTPAEATRLARALASVIVGKPPTLPRIRIDDEFGQPRNPPPPDPGMTEKYARRRLGFGRVLELVTPPDVLPPDPGSPYMTTRRRFDLLPNVTRPSWWQPARRRLYDECARHYAAAIAAHPAPTRID